MVPAQIHFTAIHHGREVDQPTGVILELHPQLFEFLAVSLQDHDVLFEFLFDLGGFLAINRLGFAIRRIPRSADLGQSLFSVVYLAELPHDVSHNGLHQGQGLIGFFRSVKLFLRRPVHGSHSLDRTPLDQTQAGRSDTRPDRSPELGFKWARFSLDPDRFVEHFGFGDGCWIERGLTPPHFQRQLRVIDDAPVAAVTAQVVVRTHKNAIDRAGFDTQGAEHAFRVVDRESVDSETLADGGVFPCRCKCNLRDRRTAHFSQPIQVVRSQRWKPRYRGFTGTATSGYS